MGMTPAQFKVFQLMELDNDYPMTPGQLVLVALDEGYIAALNKSEPIVDLDGPSPANGNTGVLSYSGPRLNPDRVAARLVVADDRMGGNGSYSGVAGAGAHNDDSLGGAFAQNQATLTVGRRNALMASLAVAAASEAMSGVGGNISGGSGGGGGGGGSRGIGSPLKGGVGVDAHVSAGGGFTSPAAEQALSPYRHQNSTHSYQDDVVVARTARRLYTLRRVAARAVARKLTLGAFSAPPPPTTPLLGGAGSLPQNRLLDGGETSAASSSSSGGGGGAFDDAFFASEESGAITLDVDLVALQSNDPAGGGPAKRRMPEGGDGSGGGTGGGGGGGMYKWFEKAMGGWGSGGPAPLTNPDCPSARLAYEIRCVYAKERREGYFDEVALRTSILAFAVLVFGRSGAFCSTDAKSAAGYRSGSIPQHKLKVEFDRERWVAKGLSFRTPAVIRLARDVASTEHLASFACTCFLSSPAAQGGLKPPNPSTNNLPPTLDLMALALDLTSTTPLPAFGTLQSKLASTLHSANVFPCLNEPPVDLASSGYTITSALAPLDAAARAPSTVAPAAGEKPTPTPVMVAALRALLMAATDMSGVGESRGGGGKQQPWRPALIEPSPLYTVRVASAATHDPHLIHVVFGVIALRLNDGEKHWQYAYRGLLLLRELLLRGSPRVLALSMSFIPLLKFLIHPIRSLAVKAGYCGEDLGGQSESSTYIQAANVCSLRAAGSGDWALAPSAAAASAAAFSPYGEAVTPPSPAPVVNSNAAAATSGAGPPLPGLIFGKPPHTSSNPAGLSWRQGRHLVSRHAGRVYLLLCSPRRWLVERSLAGGFSRWTGSAPSSHPLPLPGLAIESIAAIGATFYPSGWAPTLASPFPDTMHLSTSLDVRAAEDPQLVGDDWGSVPYQVILPTTTTSSNNAGGVKKQPPNSPLSAASWRTTPVLTGALNPPPPPPPVPEGIPPPPPLGAPVQASVAPWSVVHKVACPPILSSDSPAFNVLAERWGVPSLSSPIQQQQQQQQPFLLRSAYEESALRSSPDSPPWAVTRGASGGENVSFQVLRATTMAAANRLPRANYGGVGVAPTTSFTSPLRPPAGGGGGGGRREETTTAQQQGHLLGAVGGGGAGESLVQKSPSFSHFSAFDESTLGQVFGLSSAATEDSFHNDLPPHSALPPTHIHIKTTNEFDLSPIHAKGTSKESAHSVDPFDLGILAPPSSSTLSSQSSAVATPPQSSSFPLPPSSDPFSLDAFALREASEKSKKEGKQQKISSAALLDDFLFGGAPSTTPAAKKLQQNQSFPTTATLLDPAPPLSSTSSCSATPVTENQQCTVSAQPQQPRSRAGSRPSLSSVFAPLAERVPTSGSSSRTQSPNLEAVSGVIEEVHTADLCAPAGPTSATPNKPSEAEIAASFALPPTPSTPVFDFEFVPSEFDFSPDPAIADTVARTSAALESELKALAFAGFNLPSPLPK